MSHSPSIALLLASALWLFAPLAQAASTEPPTGTESVRAEVLLKTSSSWDGKAYAAYPEGKPELTLLKITIPPHTNLPWHTHPMPNAAYVLSGSLTVEKKADGLQKPLRAGDTLPEMVGETHRGFTGDEAVELLVFYAGSPGMALSHPAD
ncbi:cupin domain-containing protein [Chromobacterium amazonense]|uniref:cupin domain-containing protein n=1 Tax=Chromobacterium amazonense TaxID=1382803 RepID=UPI0031F68F9F